MTSSAPLVRTWTPDERESRDLILMFWKYAKPRARERERVRAWAGLVFTGFVGYLVAANGFPLLGVCVVVALGVLFLRLSFDRLVVGAVVRRLHRTGRMSLSDITFVADASGARMIRPGEEVSAKWDGSRLYRAKTMVLITWPRGGLFGIPTGVLGDEGTVTLVKLWRDATSTSLSTLAPEEVERDAPPGPECA